MMNNTHICVDSTYTQGLINLEHVLNINGMCTEYVCYKIRKEWMKIAPSLMELIRTTYVLIIKY